MSERFPVCRNVLQGVRTSHSVSKRVEPFRNLSNCFETCRTVSKRCRTVSNACRNRLETCRTVSDTCSNRFETCQNWFRIVSVTVSKRFSNVSNRLETQLLRTVSNTCRTVWKRVEPFRRRRSNRFGKRVEPFRRRVRTVSKRARNPFRNVWETCWTAFKTMSERFPVCWNVSQGVRTSHNVSKLVEPFRNVSNRFDTCQTVSKRVETVSNRVEPFFWNVSNRFETYRTVSNRGRTVSITSVSNPFPHVAWIFLKRVRTFPSVLERLRMVSECLITFQNVSSTVFWNVSETVSKRVTPFRTRVGTRLQNVSNCLETCRTVSKRSVPFRFESCRKPFGNVSISFAKTCRRLVSNRVGTVSKRVCRTRLEACNEPFRHVFEPFRNVSNSFESRSDRHVSKRFETCRTVLKRVEPFSTRMSEHVWKRVEPLLDTQCQNRLETRVEQFRIVSNRLETCRTVSTSCRTVSKRVEQFRNVSLSNRLETCSRIRFDIDVEPFQKRSRITVSDRVEPFRNVSKRCRSVSKCVEPFQRTCRTVWMRLEPFPHVLDFFRNVSERFPVCWNVSHGVRMSHNVLQRNVSYRFETCQTGSKRITPFRNVSELSFKSVYEIVWKRVEPVSKRVEPFRIVFVRIRLETCRTAFRHRVEPFRSVSKQFSNQSVRTRFETMSVGTAWKRAPLNRFEHRVEPSFETCSEQFRIVARNSFGNAFKAVSNCFEIVSNRFRHRVESRLKRVEPFRLRVGSQTRFETCRNRLDTRVEPFFKAGVELFWSVSNSFISVSNCFEIVSGRFPRVSGRLITFRNVSNRFETCRIVSKRVEPFLKRAEPFLWNVSKPVLNRFQNVSERFPVCRNVLQGVRTSS